MGQELALTSGLRESMRKLERRIDRSLEIIAVADHAADLPRNEKGLPERPPGMSERDWNIQSDALLPSKLCPVYLLGHYRRVENAQRIASGTGGENVPIIQFIQNNFQAPKYPVIDVTPIEKKEKP